ncbi:MAG: glycine/D-amino acid oxidase-like deaminating enzyme [Planctomycetota bacterium]|jgi:glycine/D-amino acid oxidase-like deaminating enzyme
MGNRLGTKRRIVIIGGGIAGIATAWGLAQESDLEVILLERESQLAAHSTGKNASILRTFTGSFGSTALALLTANFLRDAPAGFSELPLLDAVGLILIPADGASEAFNAWRSCKAEGSVVELDPSTLAKLAPHVRIARPGAYLIRDEGHIDNAALIDGMLRAARAAGVSIRTAATVKKLHREGPRISAVELADGERIEADTTVIAAGGWARNLAQHAGSGLSFEARRRHLLVTSPESRIDRSWPILWSEPDKFYTRPESGGLMICACDEDVVDADSCEVLPQVCEFIAQRADALLAGFSDASAAHFWAGMRTFSDDDEFTIGYDPSVRDLFWVAGLGGHGMSTSVGVGRLAAKLLQGEQVEERLKQAFNPARFAQTPSSAL